MSAPSSSGATPLIESAIEFAGLRLSEDARDNDRAVNEEAPLEVWLEVIEGYPDLRRWVAGNKTVPIPVLERLAEDADPIVRWTVASKRSAPSHVLDGLAHDGDESVRVRVARNRAVSVGTLRALAHDESWVVRGVGQEALSARGLSSD